LQGFILLTPDAIFPHPGAKGAGVETKEYRCPGWPLDSPGGFMENLEDVVLFQSGEGLGVLNSAL
jgi:hypothetical protein